MTGRIKADVRDILVRALANNADPDNARGVLSHAIGGLASDMAVASTAFELVSGEGRMDFHATLIALSERAKALQEFCDGFLDVNFNTSKGGAE